MTLVELLVVVSILVLLSAAVLPNLAGREGTRAVQAATASVSAQVAKAQGTAIARRAPHGVWFEHLSNNSAACIDVYAAEALPPYRGDTFNARFSLKSAPPNAAVLTETPPGCAASLRSPQFGNFMTPGNLIQFNDTGPIYDFQDNIGNWLAIMRRTATQLPSNTVWPAFDSPTAPAAHRFAIFRLPARVGPPITLGQGMAIDLLWSGVGTQRFGVRAAATGLPDLLGDGTSTPGVTDDDWLSDPAYANASTANNPARVVGMFDASGSLAEILYIANSSPSATTRFLCTEPLFLLVGRVDRCGLPYKAAPTEDNPGANWQYPESRWVVIDPRTGSARTAAPALRTSAGTPVTSARLSQSLIRAGLTAGTP